MEEHPVTRRWKRLFRGLVIGKWVLVVPFMAAGLAVAQLELPEEAQREAWETWKRQPVHVLVLLYTPCCLGLLQPVADAGLLFFKRWARSLFTIIAIGTVFSPLAYSALPAELVGETTRAEPLAQSVGLLMGLIEGAVLALAYASPVADMFAVRGKSEEPDNRRMEQPKAERKLHSDSSRH